MSADSVRIEPASAEHLGDIAALARVIWRACYPSIISPAQIEHMLTRMYDVEVMRRELESGVSYDRLLVDGELRGFASYGPLAARELKLHKLYIHPDMQKQGFGTRMLQHVESVARTRAFETIVLAVNKQNPRAIAAYRKNGFTIRESVIVDIGSGFVMDDYVMVKEL